MISIITSLAGGVGGGYIGLRVAHIPVNTPQGRKILDENPMLKYLLIPMIGGLGAYMGADLGATIGQNIEDYLKY